MVFSYKIRIILFLIFRGKDMMKDKKSEKEDINISFKNACSLVKEERLKRNISIIDLSIVNNKKFV